MLGTRRSAPSKTSQTVRPVRAGLKPNRPPARAKSVKVVSLIDHGDTHHSRLDRAICKERPKNNRSKGGGSKPFAPWCERKK
ncbi:hypothetical protein [Microviridae sp.]|nr:hypothetical protein [Microviridae sp.]